MDDNFSQLHSSIIRLALGQDAESLLAIYAPFITNTSYTFETEVPDLNTFKERISSYLETYPWLICELNGEIAGYAYAARHRERVAYQWCVESSIYVKEKFHGSGIAEALYSALIEILEKQEFRNVYAVINLPNDKSVKFHEKLGFIWFATYENVGFKLGQWKNVGWWQLHVNDFIQQPPVPFKLPELDTDFLVKVFKKYQALIRI